MPERVAGVRCGRWKDNLQEDRALNLMHGFSFQRTRLHLVQNGTAVHTAVVGTSALLNLISRSTPISLCSLLAGSAQSRT